MSNLADMVEPKPEGVPVNSAPRPVTSGYHATCAHAEDEDARAIHMHSLCSRYTELVDQSAFVKAHSAAEGFSATAASADGAKAARRLQVSCDRCGHSS